MGKYKKEWDRFIVKYFQNKQSVKVGELWSYIAICNSKIYNVYEQTIKTKGAFVANRSEEIRRLESEYDVIKFDLSGNIYLSDRLKKIERDKKIKKIKHLKNISKV